MIDQRYPVLRRGDLNGFWALFADSLTGVIHASNLGIHYDLPIVWGYGLMAILFAAAYKFCDNAPLG